MVHFFKRRWHGSLPFRLAVWLVGVLAVLIVASVSIKAAIIIAAIGVALALNYGHALVWMYRYAMRTIRRISRDRALRASGPGQRPGQR